MSEINLHHADCVEWLRAHAARIAAGEAEPFDACVTDPPYHLTSIVKRFGSAGAAACKVPEDGTGAYARASRGFMGKTWDGGDIAQRPETWRAVFDCLRPGAHLVAFGGTRTHHRMVCAIEDAGFEIRDGILDLFDADPLAEAFMASLDPAQAELFARLLDQGQFTGLLAWIYGSGFPKSHDVAKGIDKRGGADIAWFGPWLREERERRGITQKALAKHFPSRTGSLTGCVANWELSLNLPTVEQFNTLCRVLDLPFAEIAEAERAVVGRSTNGIAGGTGEFTAGNGRTTGFKAEFDLTAPATDEARRWQGWGTALKPACEPIVLARKPLSEGSVAANVVRHGTGAVNVDGCRVEHGERPLVESARRGGIGVGFPEGSRAAGKTDLGRWPANLVHDGSEAVVAGFPETATGFRPNQSTAEPKGGMIFPTSLQRQGVKPYDDSGSAARFFYSAKAGPLDRLGSKHATVKRVDLMRWLVRLITPFSALPPDGCLSAGDPASSSGAVGQTRVGHVLDPFAGSGTTGIACMAEGFGCTLIELEAEHVADIERKLAHLRGEGRTRIEEHLQRREEAKTDDGPLFSVEAA